MALGAMCHPGLVVVDLMADPILHSRSSTRSNAMNTGVLLSHSSVRTRSDKKKWWRIFETRTFDGKCEVSSCYMR
jgi:hypothetical protein